MTLSWSRALYLEFFFDQTMENFLRGHVNAFRSFSGGSRVVLYDNLRSAVLERHANLVHFNPRLLELAGHYHFDPRPCQVRVGNQNYVVELTMHQGSANIEGRWTTTKTMGPDTVNGKANTDGTVILTFLSPDLYPYTRYPYTYKISNSNGHETLSGPDLFLYGITVDLVESDPPNLKPISVPIYSYSLTSKAQGMIKTVDGRDVVDGGEIVVASVDTLLLDTDTAATGRFKWHRDYNEIGRALSGSNRQHGSGHLSFGKRPDGDWVTPRPPHSLFCRSPLAFISVKSGKGTALLPLPPLRTGRDSFPSSGSSRV